jgi:hypothetical protein
VAYLLKVLGFYMKAPQLSLLLSAAISFIAMPQRVQSQTSDRTAQPACKVTIPNQSQPPVKKFGGMVTYAPDYKGRRDLSNPDAHENGKLWTVLWANGTVLFQPNGPGFIGEDGSLSMKWPWYRGVQGRLKIRGRRLDGPAPPLRADIPEGYRENRISGHSTHLPH